MFAILTHFSPLLTTFCAERQQKLIAFFAAHPAATISILPMPRFSLPFSFALNIAFSIAIITAQTPDDTIRVTVSVNADGSRTTYKYDNAKHEAVATTADPDGKSRGKVVYRIDDLGRFGSGVVFGADGKFAYKVLYKYDAAGRVDQETRLAKDDSVSAKIVYEYNPAGKQAGYSIYDASGKLISGSGSAGSTPSSKSHKASR
jgi:YD repeat-containing protein